MGKNETALPGDVVAFMDWPWEKIEPHFHELEKRALDTDTVDAWLTDWSRLSALLSETYSRLYVATTVNTADAEAEKKYHHFLDAIFPPANAADQKNHAHHRQCIVGYRRHNRAAEQNEQDQDQTARKPQQCALERA